jgi:hypothetical protein
MSLSALVTEKPPVFQNTQMLAESPGANGKAARGAIRPAGACDACTRAPCRDKLIRSFSGVAVDEKSAHASTAVRLLSVQLPALPLTAAKYPINAALTD